MCDHPLEVSGTLPAKVNAGSGMMLESGVSSVRLIRFPFSDANLIHTLYIRTLEKNMCTTQVGMGQNFTTKTVLARSQPRWDCGIRYTLAPGLMRNMFLPIREGREVVDFGKLNVEVSSWAGWVNGCHNTHTQYIISFS